MGEMKPSDFLKQLNNSHLVIVCDGELEIERGEDAIASRGDLDEQEKYVGMIVMGEKC